MKRTVEIFTAGCPVCDPVVQMVKETACIDCEITIYDTVKLCDDKTCVDKMQRYGINRLPSIIVNGQLLDCCNQPISKDDLIKAGIGQRLT